MYCNKINTYTYTAHGSGKETQSTSEHIHFHGIILGTYIIVLQYLNKNKISIEVIFKLPKLFQIV